MLGDAEVVLVGGMENMTRVPFLLTDMRLGYRMGNTEAVDAMYRDGLLDPLCGLIMGETAENLVDLYDISRAEQDEFAAGVPAEGRRRRRGRGRPRSCPSRSRRGREYRHDRPRTSTSRPDTTMETLGQAGAGLPRGRQRHGGQLQRHHRRRGRHGADERVARHGRGPRAPRARSPAMSWAGVPPEIMGIGPGARHEEGHGATGLLARRHRGDRDQRGLRRAGDRLRTRAEVRSRPGQHARAAASRSGTRSA